jgi:hypothetical protein
VKARNVNTFKKWLYGMLQAETSFSGLLSGRIFHVNFQDNPNAYPRMSYNVLAEQDNPYDEDINAGISKTTVEFQIFSWGTSAKEGDAIESQLYLILHEKTFSTANLLVYRSYRTSRIVLYEPHVRIYRTIVRYNFDNALLD